MGAERCRDLMLEESHTEEEFLRDILGDPGLCSETESQHNLATPTEGSSLSSDETLGMNVPSQRPNLANSSPRTYILSFDNSTLIPATPHFDTSKSSSTSKKRSRNLNSEQPKPNSTNQAAKRGRNGSLDHIMAERKRRQELTERFIALSATIPGLKKVTFSLYALSLLFLSIFK